MRILDTLDCTADGVHAGNHSVWLPTAGLKFPFQHAGRIAKYTRPEQKTSDLRDTLPHEVAILRALAALGMAPPIGELVFAKTVVSTFGGAQFADPIGAYGYEIADAHKLPPGKFNLAAMQALPIFGSEGAWGDVLKPGNVVNGYLVDVRRTDWDCLRWMGDALPELPAYQEDIEALRDRVARLCSFPKGERPEPYQDYWLNDQLISGARRVAERARLLGFQPQPGESVLDIGCQTGGFLQYARYFQTSEGGAAGRLAGLDVDPDYITCAQDLARVQVACTNYLVRDAADLLKLVAWARTFYRGGLDHLLLLSMDKHLGHALLWRIVEALNARYTYLESNAQKDGQYALRTGVEVRGGRYVGDSNDRNLRRLYVVKRRV